MFAFKMRQVDFYDKGSSLNGKFSPTEWHFRTLISFVMLAFKLELSIFMEISSLLTHSIFKVKRLEISMKMETLSKKIKILICLQFFYSFKPFVALSLSASFVPIFSALFAALRGTDSLHQFRNVLDCFNKASFFTLENLLKHLYYLSHFAADN